MAAEVRALRERLGHEAMAGLQGFADDAGRRWKDDVLAVTAERFERRLGSEIGALRLDMAKELTAARVETAREIAGVRVEMAALRGEFAAGLAATRSDLLKWSVLFWIGQFAAVSGMTAFLLRTIGTR